MRETLIRLGIAAAVLLVFLFAFLVYVLLASSSPDYWAGEIAEFERLDVSNPPSKGGIVFVGGRDVRLWDTLGNRYGALAGFEPRLWRGLSGPPHLFCCTHH